MRQSTPVKELCNRSLDIGRYWKILEDRRFGQKHSETEIVRRLMQVQTLDISCRVKGEGVPLGL